MREVDTASPVVWPAWCYSGEGPVQGAETLQEGSGAADSDVRLASPKQQRSKGAASLHNGTADLHHYAASNNNNNNVKSERLSPPGGGGNVHAAGMDTNTSSSSRSGTPSGSPPPAASRPGGVSPSTSTPAAAPIKSMEHMMSRNYSDFMRSLAAKYNNANPNDYFSGPRNGFSAVPGGGSVLGDPRFGAPFKSAGTPPFVGLMAQLGSGAAVGGGSTPSPSPATVLSPPAAKDSPDQAAKVGAEAQLLANLSAHQQLFAHPAPLFPPMIDMSSTQALLNMVRTASAHSANQLETYLKGAIKRAHPQEAPNNPLDLSPHAAATPPPPPPPAPTPASKRSRGKHHPQHHPSLSESLYGDALLNLPLLMRTAPKDRPHAAPTKPGRPGSVSPKLGRPGRGTAQARTTAPAAAAPSCLSLCTAPDKPCSSQAADSQTVAHWTVDDVATFVIGIDICAEYAPNFREQRIDGSALPLLTEDHLTNTLGMKLGPALKLRAILSRRLGHCSVCLHCVHCHGASPLSPGVVRPNSTGN